MAGGVEPADVVGHMPSREITVHAQEVAINAVMAGCRPDYMPVVSAAVRALLDERHIAHSTTATLAGPSQVVIVNGPIRDELAIAYEGACFGPGFRANATIGRALRLVVRNVLRSVPGVSTAPPSRLLAATRSASEKTRTTVGGRPCTWSVASTRPPAR